MNNLEQQLNAAVTLTETLLRDKLSDLEFISEQLATREQLLADLDDLAEQGCKDAKIVALLQTLATANAKLITKLEQENIVIKQQLHNIYKGKAAIALYGKV